MSSVTIVPTEQAVAAMDDLEALHFARQAADRVREQVAKKVVGQGEVIDLLRRPRPVHRRAGPGQDPADLDPGRDHAAGLRPHPVHP